MAKTTLRQKLSAVQHTLKAPKGQMNNFGGYKYRSAEDILEAVKPLLFEQGITLVLTDEPILVGDWHYVKATAVLTDDESEVRVSAVARESAIKKGMDDSQITGTASSYARKYALNGLFCIDDTKDADTDAYRRQTTDVSHQILSAVKQAGLDVTKMGTIIRNKYGKARSTECTAVELADLLKNFKEYYAELEAEQSEGK